MKRIINAIWNFLQEYGQYRYQMLRRRGHGWY